MSQLNMKELYSTINEKTLKRMEIYDDVLKKCHLRIKYNSTLERTYCFYQIPEFIIGVPLYDVNEMKIYVMNSLKNNGFELLYIDPNWLFITWHDKGTKILIQNGAKDNNPKKIQTNNYRSIDSYKPTGSFVSDGVYGQSAMMGLSDKLK